MPCKELVEVVTDYLERALPERDRLRLEAHLAECEPCRHYIEQIHRTVELAGRLEPEHISPELREGLLRAFRDWRATRS